MNESKLKPCPFCGSEAKTEIYCGDNSTKIYLRIYCSKCERVEQKVKTLSGCMFARFEDVLDEICGMWNRRANDGNCDL